MNKIARFFFYIILSSNFTFADEQPQVNLSVTEQLNVNHTILSANMRVQYEDADAHISQKAINDKVNEAKSLIDSSKDVILVNSKYNVYRARHINNSKHESKNEYIWRSSQNIILESTNYQQLLELIGNLQSMNFTVDNLSYNISETDQKKADETLTTIAVSSLQAKAAAITKALGYKKYKFTTISFGNGYISPIIENSAINTLQKSNTILAPTSGKSKVQLTINATIKLLD